MDMLGKLAAMSSWIIWLAVAFGPALLYARHLHYRELRRRNDLAEIGLRFEPPDRRESLKHPVIGMALLALGFFTAYGAMGNPERAAYAAYNRVAR